eukprot:scaffold138158_cov130-Phaeocystis_antarctica.AAC.1
MPIFGFLEALSSDWSARNVPKHGEVLHVVAGCTSSEVEGQGIGYGLRVAAVQLAHGRKFTSLLVEATAGATQHIWKKKLGGSQVGELKFADYVDAATGSRPFATLTEPMGATLLQVPATAAAYEELN